MLEPLIVGKGEEIEAIAGVIDQKVTVLFVCGDGAPATLSANVRGSPCTLTHITARPMWCTVWTVPVSQFSTELHVTKSQHGCGEGKVV